MQSKYPIFVFIVCTKVLLTDRCRRQNFGPSLLHLVQGGASNLRLGLKWKYLRVCVITFEPIKIQTCSSLQNDLLNLSFVKDVEVVVKETARNGRKTDFCQSQSLVNSLYVLLQVDQGVLEELIDKELPTLGTKLKTLGATQMIVSDIYFSWGMVFLNVVFILCQLCYAASNCSNFVVVVFYKLIL